MCVKGQFISFLAFPPEVASSRLNDSDASIAASGSSALASLLVPPLLSIGISAGGAASEAKSSAQGNEQPPISIFTTTPAVTQGYRTISGALGIPPHGPALIADTSTKMWQNILMKRVSIARRFRLSILLLEYQQAFTTATTDDVRRLTLLTISRTAYRRREETRIAAINAANIQRDPDAILVRPVVGAWPLALTLVGMLLGAVGLTPLLNQGTITRRAAPLLTTDQWLLPAGIMALISIAILAYLEPLRARGSIYHGGWEARLYLVLAAIYIGFALWELIFQLHDLTVGELTRSILGCLVMLGAGLWAIELWRRGRITDKKGCLLLHYDPLQGLDDIADARKVYAALDCWWQKEAEHQIATRPQLCESIGNLVLSRFKDFGYSITTTRRSVFIATNPKELWQESRESPDVWIG